MALKIKTKNNGRECIGILRINSVNSTRGANPGAGMSFGGVGTNNKTGETKRAFEDDKFFTTIEYSVEINDGEKQRFYSGKSVQPYNINNKKNIFEYAYNTLKTVPHLKDSEDC